MKNDKKVLVMVMVLSLILAAPLVARAYDIRLFTYDKIEGIATGEIRYAFSSDEANILPTFCVERGATVHVPGVYDASYDLITAGGFLTAAYLIETYAPLTHAAYWGGYTYLHDISIALQFAVWHFTNNSFTTLPSSGNIYDLYDMFVTAGESGNSPVGTYAVAHLTDSTHTANYQDMIVSYSTPEPISILMLGFGLVGIAGLRRKFNK